MSVIKLQSPFERLKIANNSPEVALRKAIILQAIIDASEMLINNYTQKSKKICNDAYKWLFGKSNDFHTVCNEADLNPTLVQNIAKQFMTLNLTTTNKKK